MPAVEFHSFDHDSSQGGTTFRDPDGDVLQYSFLFRHSGSGQDTPNPPPGLQVTGTRIVGTPQQAGFIVVIVTVSDILGWTASDEFLIDVRANGVPTVTRPNEDLLTSVGGFVDADSTQGGETFADAEGDALTYSIALRGDPRGLTVNGARVTGVMNSIGLLEVTVTARDPFGATGSDLFLIAAPAPEPGEPDLPDPSYVYRDASLELPFFYQDQFSNGEREGNLTTDAGATLGRVLFYDRRMSITNTVACGSCHVQSHGFATPVRFNTGALGVPLKRHAMALGNVRFNGPHFWFSDMRTEVLEQLVLEPIGNPEELGSSFSLLQSKLLGTSFYQSLFEAAFGTPEITQDRVARALTQFLRSLIAYRSKHDLAFNPMANEPWQPELVLTPQEMRGFDIFQDGGRGRCNMCHDAHLTHTIWQANNGLDIVPTDLGTQNAGLQRDGSLGVFRAAALRNIAVTAPYMHDGRFATLRDVINHYDHGVQDSPHLDSLLRDVLGNGLPKQMNLTEQDKDALEAFLNTMTDQAFLTDPKFSDPFQ